MNCTFFGHRDAPASIAIVLENEIRKIIEKGEAKEFYVGNNGNFDCIVQKILEKIRKETGISYSIVLSHLNEKALSGLQKQTIFPEGLENALPRFAISKRNDWLIKNSSLVIVYASYCFSNTKKLAEKAAKKGLKVIYITEEKNISF